MFFDILKALDKNKDLDLHLDLDWFGSGSGSKSGSVTYLYGYADLDPYQNVTNPQHCSTDQQIQCQPTTLPYSYVCQLITHSTIILVTFWDDYHLQWPLPSSMGEGIFSSVFSHPREEFFRKHLSCACRWCRCCFLYKPSVLRCYFTDIFGFFCPVHLQH